MGSGGGGGVTPTYIEIDAMSNMERTPLHSLEFILYYLVDKTTETRLRQLGGHDDKQNSFHCYVLTGCTMTSRSLLNNSERAHDAQKAIYFLELSSCIYDLPLAVLV